MGDRDLWAEPITVPVLNLETFAGGRTPVSRGGGQRTTSIRLHGADGRDFYFRSNRTPAPNSPQLRKTMAAVVQDQTSLGLSHCAADRFQFARCRHGQPLLNDERLGEFQKDYAGLIGFLEPRVAAPAPGRPGGNATEIIGATSCSNG